MSDGKAEIERAIREEADFDAAENQEDDKEASDQGQGTDATLSVVVKENDGGNEEKNIR